jgi:hypothetical protein
VCYVFQLPDPERVGTLDAMSIARYDMIIEFVGARG